MSDEAATLPGGSATPRIGGERAPRIPSYLLVFELESAAMFELPLEGEVTIGRGDHADLKLRDPAASRLHARIRVSEATARIADVGSQNGTLVNGQLVVGERVLLSGDVIGICSSTLVYHSRSRAAVRRGSLPFPAFRQRAEEELSRALRYSRPLTLLTLALGNRIPDKLRVDAATAEQLRLTDVFGWDSSGELLVILLPETCIDDAHIVAERLLEHPGIGPDARAGLATCPADGCDFETLLATSRRAAGTAQAKGVESANATAQVFEVGPHRVLIAAPAMTGIYSLVRRLATSDLPVLIQGETGSGKELVASALHHWSNRQRGPLISLSCAALPETLVESELLGYERGAFSGATSSKAGLIEEASGGTLLLDEVGELPLGIQAKFLRVLESQRVMRLGEAKERPVDVRIVAATNRDLAEEVKAGRFRRDLFFRLSGGLLWIPPLRDREQDVPMLAKAFLAGACERIGRSPMQISAGAMQVLSTYNWPGNVRELKNVLEYVAAAFPDPVLEARHVEARLGTRPSNLATPRKSSSSGDTQGPVMMARASRTPVGEKKASISSPGLAAFRPVDEEVAELERNRMRAALEASGGNRTRAAQLIGMPLRTFVAKLKKYELGERFPR